MARSRSGLAFLVLALLALASFSAAFVRSDVMQASMALADMPAGDAMADGDAMPGMVMAGDRGENLAAPHHRRDAGHGDKTACPYCAAAAHLPLGVLGGPCIGRTTSVSFIRFRPAAARGPRGPPALDVRVRGPPDDPFSA